MTALDFPSNPTNGQEFQGYVWNATKGVWDSNAGLDFNITDLADVNTSGVADGDALVYDEATSSWIPGEGSSASITVSDTPPSAPEAGNLWLDSITGNTYIYYSDADTNQWVQTAGPNITPNRGANLIVSSAAPPSPVSGDLWYDPTEGYTYLYYVDEDSSQWVQFGLNRNGSNGETGIAGADGADGVGVPVGGTEGQALVKSSSTDYAVEWSDVSAGSETAKTITSDSIALDFSDNIQLEQRAVAGDVTFTASNYTSGVKKTIYLEGDAVKRSLTFPAAWNFITDKPTNIGADKKNILDLNSFGTSESTTVALWLGASAFEPTVATGGAEYTLSMDGVEWRVHSFTFSASLSVSSVGSLGTVDYLVVAGGGGGGAYYSGGGGGAGGLLTSISGELSAGGALPGSMSEITNTDYLVTVGLGGAGGTATGATSIGQNGQNSLFNGIVATGGGGGGGGGYSALSGGSGGGGGGNGGQAGTGSQGYDGGSGISASPNYGAGGGGGAGSAGQNGNNSISGEAGIGLISSITGQSLYYSGGGGAGTHTGTNSTRTLGGLGGGGDGGFGGGNYSGLSGTANTGGGGGGATYQSAAGAVGGSGGSGIVIIRYPITDPN